MERVVIYGLSDRKSDIRSVNCISLVGLRIFSRQESVGTVFSIQRDSTDCKTRILKRCSRFIAGFFWQSSSARAPRSLVQLFGGGLKLGIAPGV